MSLHKHGSKHGSHKKKKTKSRKQVGFLMSDNTPLSEGQRAKLQRELEEGKVKVRG